MALNAPRHARPSDRTIARQTESADQLHGARSAREATDDTWHQRHADTGPRTSDGRARTCGRERRCRRHRHAAAKARRSRSRFRRLTVAGRARRSSEAPVGNRAALRVGHAERHSPETRRTRRTSTTGVHAPSQHAAPRRAHQPVRDDQDDRRRRHGHRLPRPRPSARSPRRDQVPAVEPARAHPALPRRGARHRALPARQHRRHLRGRRARRRAVHGARVPQRQAAHRATIENGQQAAVLARRRGHGARSLQGARSARTSRASFTATSSPTTSSSPTSGTIKVLDFGIAKVLQRRPGAAAAESSGAHSHAEPARARDRHEHRASRATARSWAR